MERGQRRVHLVNSHQRNSPMILLERSNCVAGVLFAVNYYYLSVVLALCRAVLVLNNNCQILLLLVAHFVVTCLFMFVSGEQQLSVSQRLFVSQWLVSCITHHSCKPASTCY